MWTLKWGAKSGPRFGVRRIVFSFRGPQNGVQILGTILGSTLPVFFSQHDAQKGHPRVGCEQVRLLHKHIAGTVTKVITNQGDNSVQHWILFCPVTALAGSLLLNRPWTTASWFFSRTFSLSQRSVIAGLWVASRQLCHERSALPPPSLDPPPAYSSNPLALARLLVDRALALIPPPFRPTHVHQSIPLEITPGCFRDFVQFRTLTLEAEGHPNYYGLVPAVAASVPADHILAVLPLRSNLPKRLFMFQSSVPAPPNCTLQFRLCSCGTIHGYLVTLSPLAPHSPIHVGDPPTHESDFVLHFDGGAFRDLAVGGAGTVLWLHSHGRLLHLSSYCIPLAPMC